MSPADKVTEAIQALDQASTREELLVATRTLSTLGSLDAATKLIEVLSHNNPATAVVATRGLIQLGPAVIPQLLDNLDVSDYTTRTWIITILADLKDIRSLDVLIDAARTDISPSVRRTALRGISTLNRKPTCKEGAHLSQCLNALMVGCSDPEWVVRYAAVFGLERCLDDNRIQPNERAMALTCLQRCAEMQESARVVQCRAQLALKRLSKE